MLTEQQIIAEKKEHEAKIIYDNAYDKLNSSFKNKCNSKLQHDVEIAHRNYSQAMADAQSTFCKNCNSRPTCNCKQGK